MLVFLAGQVKRDGGKWESFHSVLSLLSYMLKAPLVPQGTPVVNALFAQRQVCVRLSSRLIAVGSYCCVRVFNRLCRCCASFRAIRRNFCSFLLELGQNCCNLCNFVANGQWFVIFVVCQLVLSVWFGFCTVGFGCLRTVMMHSIGRASVLGSRL